MFVKRLLCSSLIIIVSVFSYDYRITEPSEEGTYRQSSYISPKQYDIILTSYVKEDAFVGNCNISIRIIHPIQRIQLYLDIKRIIDTTVINDPIKFTFDGKKIVYEPVKPAWYDNRRNITEYVFLNYLLKGDYIIQLNYNITDDTGLKKFYKRNEGQW